MKLYIAASSDPRERERVDAAFAGAAAIPGVDIVGDWRASVDEHGANPDHRGVARVAAMKCLLGVDHCHVIWFLIPVHESRGAWFEAGYAWGTTKRLISSGRTPTSVFVHLGSSLFGTDGEALLELRRLESMGGYRAS